MASYHFTIKTDTKPDGTKVQATDHADYNSRTGKYKDIDERREKMLKRFTGNSISSPNATLQNEKNNTAILLYKDKNGVIIENNNCIEPSGDASMEILHAALLLASKRYGATISITGSTEFKAKAIVAAVEIDLPIHFMDQEMELERKKLQEVKENVGRKNLKSGSNRNTTTALLHQRHPKQNPFGTLASGRTNLQTLSECPVVQYPEDTELLLQNDVSNYVADNATNHTMRWTDTSGKLKAAETIVSTIRAKTSASDHIDYINRDEGFAYKGGCIYQAHHLPKWAEDSSKKFWSAAAKYEQTGTVYREIEFALPNELTLPQQLEIVNKFINNHLGQDFYWSYAIHDKYAAMGNGQRNPHVHIMFSERKLDDIEKQNERTSECFFKKANRVHREKGGSNKDPKWNSNKRFAYTAEMRKNCAMIQNEILEKYGYDIRVDHRSLYDQQQAALERGDLVLAKILNRAPEENVGPKRVYNPNDEKVIDIKKYREVRKAYQKLIIAADLLTRTIEKDNNTESANYSVTDANVAISEIESHKLQQNIELQHLTESIHKTSKELSVVRNLIIWDEVALAAARRYFMTPEEQTVETRTKLIKDEILNLKRLDKRLIKPKNWSDESLKEYTDQKQAIKNRLHELEQESKETAEKLRTINVRFHTPDYKLKLKRVQNEILAENKATKELAASLQQTLDTCASQIRSIINDHIAKQSRLIQIHIGKLIAPHLAEKALLQKERQALLAEKTQFDTKRKPKFFDPSYEIWKQENDTLQHKEAILTEKETAIDEKITAIKNAVYGPEEIEKSLPLSIQKSEVQKIQFTAREIQSLIRESLDSLITERNQIDAQLKKLEHNIMSQPRALEMAKNNFVQGAFKTLRDEQRDLIQEAERIKYAITGYTEKLNAFKLKKRPELFKPQIEKDAYEQERKDLELLNSTIKSRQARILLLQTGINQKRTDLETKCSTPEAKLQIDKIAKGIITKSSPASAEYTLLQQKRTAIIKEIDMLTTTKKFIDSQVKYDDAISSKTKKTPTEYKMRIKNTAFHSSGGHTTSSQNNLPNPAQIIANAISGNSYAVPLIARIVDGEEYDFSAMTPEQIETAIAKIKIQQSL